MLWRQVLRRRRRLLRRQRWRRLWRAHRRVKPVTLCRRALRRVGLRRPDLRRLASELLRTLLLQLLLRLMLKLLRVILLLELLLVLLLMLVLLLLLEVLLMLELLVLLLLELLGLLLALLMLMLMLRHCHRRQTQAHATASTSDRHRHSGVRRARRGYRGGGRQRRWRRRGRGPRRHAESLLVIADGWHNGSRSRWRRTLPQSLSLLLLLLLQLLMVVTQGRRRGRDRRRAGGVRRCRHPVWLSQVARGRGGHGDGPVKALCANGSCGNSGGIGSSRGSGRGQRRRARVVVAVARSVATRELVRGEGPRHLRRRCHMLSTLRGASNASRGGTHSATGRRDLGGSCDCGGPRRGSSGVRAGVRDINSDCRVPHGHL